MIRLACEANILEAVESNWSWLLLYNFLGNFFLDGEYAATKFMGLCPKWLLSSVGIGSTSSYRFGYDLAGSFVNIICLEPKKPTWYGFWKWLKVCPLSWSMTWRGFIKEKGYAGMLSTKKCQTSYPIPATRSNVEPWPFADMGSIALTIVTFMLVWPGFCQRIFRQYWHKWSTATLAIPGNDIHL